mmetsp:Transcript_95518/g.116988  ORF Transcript_95518/g.116988 Transcript_95518/m.116988 type:complete len:204 (+) Transcript_95518:53-664(+)
MFCTCPVPCALPRAAPGAIQRLKLEFQFPPDLAVLFSACDTGMDLLTAKDEGTLKISDDDPLLLIAFDMADDNALRYVQGGNFNLPVGVPGALQWPGGGPPPPGAAMPHGVAAGLPNALGAFVAMQPGVNERSNGHYTLFYVQNQERVNDLCKAVQRETQFRRHGPMIAARLGLIEEPPLVTAVTLNSITGPPQRMPLFNCTV